MPGDRRHARRYSACSSLGEEPCGSRIAWLCPATPSGPAAERPDAAATDCVLNRLFRPMRDAVPLLERSCRTSRVASVRAPDESRPRPAGNAGRDEGAPTYGALYPGARFVGEQRAADEGLHAGGAPKAYPVTVTLQDVALGQAALCGYLTIRNLTAEHPSLTTFFEAEVVGPRAGFLTRRWDATPDTDLRHWLRFPYFRAHCRPYFDAELSGSSSSGLVRDSLSEAERHAEYAAGRGNESGSLNTGGGLGDALLRRLAAASVESLGAPPSPGTDAWRVYHAGASHSTVFASPAPWSVVGTRADGGRVSPAPSVYVRSYSFPAAGAFSARSTSCTSCRFRRGTDRFGRSSVPFAGRVAWCRGTPADRASPPLRPAPVACDGGAMHCTRPETFACLPRSSCRNRPQCPA